MRTEDIQEMAEYFRLKELEADELTRLGLEGFVLDDKAHVPLETLKKLAKATLVGDPREWMHCVGRVGEFPIPSELENRMLEIDQILVKEYFSEVTNLANNGDSEKDEDKLKYQKSIRMIAGLIAQAHEDDISRYSPDETAAWEALRGAKFFEQIYAKFFGDKKIEVEVKRLGGKDGDYAVGTGDVAEPSQYDIETLRQFILFDDCLSTGMSQVASLRLMFEKGYRPSQIVMPIIVSTVDGYNKVLEEAEKIKQQYGVEFDLIISCAVICHSVDGAMYLRTSDGKQYLVGDMGEFLKAVVRDM